MSSCYKYFIVVLVAGLFLAASRGYAFDFYGADVSDREVPSSYLRVGLFGIKPVVNSVAFDSVAAKAGLQRGDIILSINGADVKKSSELRQFTSNVLSVSIHSGIEMKLVFIERLAPGTAKTNSIPSEKAVTNQNRGVYDVPAAVINAPSVKTGSHAAETDHRKPAPIAAPLHQTSFEVLTRNNTTLGASSQRQSRKEIQERTIREAPVKPKITEDNKAADTYIPATPGTREMAATKRDIFASSIKPAHDQFVLESSKGNVTFRHSIHLKSLNKEQCMLCHRTSKPDLESIQSRLDSNRAGHSFCRGCHQKMDKGPTTECHECHNSMSMN